MFGGLNIGQEKSEWSNQRDYSVLERENRKKAQSVYDAVRLAHQTHVPRMAMESILSSVYRDEVAHKEGVLLSSLQGVYDEWRRGKGRVISEKTNVNRRNLLARFVGWCAERKVREVVDVTVGIAREYVQYLMSGGRANKTVRNIIQHRKRSIMLDDILFVKTAARFCPFASCTRFKISRV